MRTAQTDLRAICKAICNTCYVDDDVLAVMLSSEGLDPNDYVEDTPSSTLIRLAIEIVKGWVETSRSEGGISVSVDVARVNRNIAYWAKKGGIEAEVLDDNGITVRNASNLW